MEAMTLRKSALRDICVQPGYKYGRRHNVPSAHGPADSARAWAQTGSPRDSAELCMVCEAFVWQ